MSVYEKMFDPEEGLVFQKYNKTQCMYDVTKRRIRVNIGFVEKQ